MNAFWGMVFKWVIQIFGALMPSITPAITAELNAFLTTLYRKALATPNPMDDFFVGLLLDILAIPRPPPE